MNERIRLMALANKAFTVSRVTTEEVVAFAALVREDYERVLNKMTHTEQEPVAWADTHDVEREGHDFYVNRQPPVKDGVPLYIAPQREWVGLTDDGRCGDPDCDVCI